MKLTCVSGVLPVEESKIWFHINKAIGEIKDRHSCQVLAVSGLSSLGYELGFQPYPEYPIKVKSMRSGKGYIDIVWLLQEKLICAFEIVNSAGGPRDIAKLALCENGFLVQLRRIDIKRANVIKAENMLQLPIGELQRRYWPTLG